MNRRTNSLRALWLIPLLLPPVLPACSRAPEAADAEQASATAVGEGDIPVTTTSEEARALFLEARTLNENLRGIDARPLLQQAVELDPTFASAYLLLANTAPVPKEFFSNLEKAVANAKTPSDVSGVPSPLRSQLARASAWSPNPNNPPLYVDLPTRDGVVRPEILAKWASNAVLTFADQYVGNLRRYRAIAIDVGDQDGLRVDTGKLHEWLDTYRIVHAFEIYPGTHTSKMGDRFQNHVLPFFSRSLCFDGKCQ